MITKACLIFSAIAFSAQLHAQSNNKVPDNIRATNAIDALSSMNVSPGYMLYGISEAPGEVVGNVYLNEEWKKTTLKVIGYEKEVNDYSCKVNLYSNLIEVKIDNVIKVIDGAKVESFRWTNEETGGQSFYRNASAYQIKGIPQTGFLEVLIDGKIPLFKKIQVDIKKPDYNMALNIGSKSTKIVKEEILYFAKDKELVKIKSIKNRNFTALFGEFSSEVDRFIQAKSLRTSVEADLVLIFKYYNEEVEKVN
jgi:hypothetical protein